MRKDLYGFQETQSANSRLQKPKAQDILAHAQATVINVNVPQKAAAPAIGGGTSSLSKGHKVTGAIV